VLTDLGDSTTDVTYRLALDVSIPLIGMLKRKGEKILIDTAPRSLKKHVETLPIADPPVHRQGWRQQSTVAAAAALTAESDAALLVPPTRALGADALGVTVGDERNRSHPTCSCTGGAPAVRAVVGGIRVTCSPC
jgi:hypothetical protein